MMTVIRNLFAAATAVLFAALPATDAQTPANSVPVFEVNPAWPAKLPDGWTWGQVLGINADARNHVWLTTRGQVAEFDPAGKVLQVWNARAANSQWTTIHGMFVDHNNFVWTNAREQHQILKFTREGKLVLTIGKFNETGGSNDPNLLGRPADMYVSPATNELFVVDGYTNHRVIVFNAETGKYLRHWGAYGERPDDADRRPAGTDAPPSRQLSVPHGITGSRDGMIYVADRTNSRIQAFERSGKFVMERILRTGNGAAFSVTLSPDPEQQFMYVPDGTEHKIWILRRKGLEVLGNFAGPGKEPGQLGRPHNITVDSRGHIYVTEADPGMRAQMFTFKGVKAR